MGCIALYLIGIMVALAMSFSMLSAALLCAGILSTVRVCSQGSVGDRLTFEEDLLLRDAFQMLTDMISVNAYLWASAFFNERFVHS